jgi:hypothetical protein
VVGLSSVLDSSSQELDTMPDSKTTTAKEQLANAQATIAALSAEVREMRVRLGDLDARMESMEIARPPELRRLSLDAVVAAVAENPYVELEVLKSWESGFTQFAAGAKIRADRVPFLIDFIRAGLMVGPPSDQAETVARLRAQADAQAAAAIAETELAKAAHGKAQAEAAAARAVEARATRQVGG